MDARPLGTADWAAECDVLVAGSGGGGVTGAYTAAREGLDVLLVEATSKFGGTTAYSGGGGVWFPCNPVLLRAGVDDTIDDALTYYRAVVGDRTPREMQETYVRGGAPLIEYLEADPNLKFVPLPWPDYYGKAPKARVDGQRHIAAKPLKVDAAPELREAIRGPLDTDRLGAEPPSDYYVGGRALIARFLRAIGQYPTASLRRETELVELVVSDGQVTGAIVETAGERRAIRARRGVLLAAGGFEANEELRRRYGVPGTSRDTMGGPGSRGLALQAGIAAGADTDLLDQAWWSPGMTHPDGRSAFALWFTGGIFVNQDGNRFVNESMAYDRAGREIIAQLQDGSITLPYWMIYDDKEGEVPPVKAANVAIVETEKYVAAGLWHTADTLEELAGEIGVPGGQAAATRRSTARSRRARRRWCPSTRRRITPPRSASPIWAPRAACAPTPRRGCSTRPASRYPAFTRRATPWPRPAAPPIPAAATRSEPACCSAIWRCWTCATVGPEF
jgi:3-oxosteroid 1-dehydrogenase